MNADLISLFVIFPFAAAFFTLVQKSFPQFKAAKPAGAVMLISWGVLLFLYAPVIGAGEHPSLVLGGWDTLVGIRQTLTFQSFAGLALSWIIMIPIFLFMISQKGLSALFYFLVYIQLGGVAGLLLADDLFNLFVFLEIVGICTYILVAYKRHSQAVFACFQYLMVSSVAISFFLIGLFILYTQTGSFQFEIVTQFFTNPDAPLFQKTLCASSLLIGIGVRTGFLPLLWLPGAYANSPHAISALLSSVVTKVYFLILWKLVISFHLASVREFLLVSGALTALITVVKALTQRDVKLLLAWSSISQMGFIFVGFGVANALGEAGALYHAVSHGLFKSLLFIATGLIVLISGKRSEDELCGVGRQFPLLGLFFFIAVLSIVGIPPFTGFVSKSMITYSVKEYPLISTLLTITSVGTAAAYIRLSRIFWGKPHSGKSSLSSAGFLPTKIALALLSLLCILFGVMGKPIIGLLGSHLTNSPIDFHLWDYWGHYGKTVLVTAAGALLYRGMNHPAAIRVQSLIRNGSLSFDSLLTIQLFFWSGMILIFLIR